MAPANRRTLALLVVLVAAGGLLALGIVGGEPEPRCAWAVTVGTDGIGYLVVPCAERPRDPFLRRGIGDGTFYCDPRLRMAAPQNDLARCPPGIEFRL
jgi:hypothetical protein